MRSLTHLHFRSPISYRTAAFLQESLVSRFLDSKPPSSLPAPTPYILTAEFNPVYTCGRREIGTVSEEQQDYLRNNGSADFVEALRGGQTTFHGPGQLVAYPILDLRTHKLTPRSYVCLLEKSLIRTCRRYAIDAMTTEHTGVWTTPEDKIAAIGVHMRRNITSHGIGLNVATDLWWFERIVACGLQGKRTTSFEREGVGEAGVRDVGKVFVGEVAEILELDYVEERDAEEYMEEFKV
ncbi:lipoyltransferase [Massarina eburnea CBS 473.64]|uniref:Octanoyltransferase n=1 Tax=Massarina eburnea CBS 473.64 TaxID=1395130 RepID=A0A6A6SAJ3_9PLEO|nr:lipoyltransferase [Massarina eburnea CBS 473.64]